MALTKLKQRWSAMVHKIKDDQAEGAQRTVLQEVFNDLYRDRFRVYRMNFVRGVFFGLGSALGGTLVIALIIWIFSLFVDFPLVGEYFEGIQQSIDREQ